MSATKTVHLLIERENSHFPVEVIAGQWDTGYFEHPVDASGDRRIALTIHEQDEARALADEPSLDDSHDDFSRPCRREQAELDIRGENDWAQNLERSAK